MAVRRDRLSYHEKNKNKQEWYKERINKIAGNRLSEEDRLRYKVNHDLYRNKLDMSQFNHICKPFGDDVGSLPATFENRDIVSGKIKALIGMEMQRPFSYKVFATNPEATTAKEKAIMQAIRESVINDIMAPIRQQIEAEMQQQQAMMGQGMDPQQAQKQMQQLQQESELKQKQMTPMEVKRYMEMEYQDPAEVLASQLLEYMRYKCDVENIFSDMFKNTLITGRSVVYVGISNDEPDLKLVDPSRFNFSKTYDTKFIEDGEWAVCEYRMSASQIASYFSQEISNSDLDRLYEMTTSGISGFSLFDRDGAMDDDDFSVIHCVWKSLRKIGFLTYIDENGEEQEMVVDESYVIEEDLGDVSITWEWIPECYEGWRIDISDPIYLRMRPVPGQFKDIDNIRVCKLPYYGLVIDEYEGEEVSLMDRLRGYQYFYNIAMYRLELLMASDKGKKLMMNINSVPDSLGISIDKWQYFVESSPYIWYNPNEEGAATGDANTVAKVMDLSLVSDIKKYIEIAEYIRQQAGKSVGITDQVEGQIGQYEAVRNTNQAITQSSYILEGYFNAHERCKINILTALIETAKVCYSSKKQVKLSYILDDMSSRMLTVDPVMLDNNTFGIFVSSSAKSVQTKEMIQQLAHAALQTQTVDFTDIISVLNAESAPEAKAILMSAQKRKQELMEEQQRQEHEQAKELEQLKLQQQQQKFEQDKELTILKEEEKRKTELATMSIMGASYNPDHDADNDGMNDFLEISKHTLAKYTAEENLKMQKDKLALEAKMAEAKSNREDYVAKHKVKSLKR